MEKYQRWSDVRTRMLKRQKKREQIKESNVPTMSNKRFQRILTGRVL